MPAAPQPGITRPARLPDVTAIAPGSDIGAVVPPTDPPSDEAFVDPDYADNTDSVGTGYCVPLVQLNSKSTSKPPTDIGGTSLWKPGAKLKDKPKLVAGTVIATFDAQGKYESKSQGNHAAFFVKYATEGGKEGIVIYDQYRLWPPTKKKREDLAKKRDALANSKAAKASEELEKLKKEIADIDDQWKAGFPELDDVHGRFARKEPGERFIRFDHGGNPSNDASAFSVVNR